ncbi:MAG: heavy metal translocating P-type ATPase [Dehalococcoidales bacterium]|nr:heavy metal translocating P-type ATPase [Dehalococcoidales bacterium]
MDRKFSVKGMTCSACSASVERSVKKLDGINTVNVNLLTGSMVVDYDDEITDDGKIIRAVTDAGYNASVFFRDEKATSAVRDNAGTLENELTEIKRRFILSLVFLIPLLYVSMGHMAGLPLPSWMQGISNAITMVLVQLLLTLPVIYLNRKFYLAGFKALYHRSPNMDSLIAVGSTAAVVYGLFAFFRIGYGLGHSQQVIVQQYMTDLYFESAATILTLVTLGKWLETRSKGRTSEAINRLMDLSPKMAAVLRDGREIEIPVENVMIDDLVLVRPGQSVPVDGIIVEGRSTVDQSALTGESLPVEKQAGDSVLSATINKEGIIKFRAEKVGNNTTLARIIELVENAGASRAPVGRLADKISGVFVPAVIGIAIITSAAWLITGQSAEFALSAGIAVLVISCPCALGLATPVAIMVATGKGASNGILFKTAEALETIHSVNTVVLDKTGTITQGKPAVTGLFAVDGVTEKHLLEIAASIEKPSEHPFAEAVVRKAAEEGIAVKDVEEFAAVSGRGISAVMDGRRYLAGNLAFITEQQVDPDSLPGESASFIEKGDTLLYFAEDKKLLGVLAVADDLKPSSREAVAELKAMGIEVVMLTGDNRQAAEAIRSKMDIDKAIAGVLPEDKEKEIMRLRESGKMVAMVGDGINDAPAMAGADVGVAIGAGTDIAIESADIVLMKNDLMDVVTAIRISKATLRNIRQNLFWAFFYNTLGIPLAAGAFYFLLGWKLNPMFAAAAMSLSSVFVVSNALRLRYFKARRNASGLFNEKQEVVSDGGSLMKKEIVINGMHCENCQKKVEEALNSIHGVKARVDLKKKTATVTLEADIDEQTFKKAISDAGFEVVSITEKKGLFGR